jgi:hypothetical protein
MYLETNTWTVQRPGARPRYPGRVTTDTRYTGQANLLVKQSVAVQEGSLVMES